MAMSKRRNPTALSQNIKSLVYRVHLIPSILHVKIVWDKGEKSQLGCEINKDTSQGDVFCLF